MDRGRPSTRNDANKKEEEEEEEGEEEEEEEGKGEEESASTTKSKTTEKISTPTLHLHGLKDPHLPNGRRQLAASYDAAAATLYEIDYHHAMPWNKSEAARLADLIVKMCWDTATTRSPRSGSSNW
jgi:pimeloyl-ACP methyl ester carboxylesterase